MNSVNIFEEQATQIANLMKLKSQATRQDCIWREDIDEIFHTSCGQAYNWHTLFNVAGNNTLIYCPNCGEKIINL